MSPPRPPKMWLTTTSTRPRGICVLVFTLATWPTSNSSRWRTTRTSSSSNSRLVVSTPCRSAVACHPSTNPLLKWLKLWSDLWGPSYSRSPMLRLLLCSFLPAPRSRVHLIPVSLCRSIIPLFPRKWSRCICMRHSPGHSRETICKLSSTALESPSGLSLMILDLVFFLLMLLSISEKKENPDLLRTMAFQ
jgi:hypothetical protein